MLKNIFKKSLEEKSMKSLQGLGKKFMEGLSVATDINEWEENLKIVIEGKRNLYPMPVDGFIWGMEKLFTKYKLKHYPNMALSIIKDIKVYKGLRKGLYREMIILALAEVPWIIHKWEYDNKKDYEYLKKIISEYVNTERNRECVYTTRKCDKCSDEELISVLNIIKRSVLDYTPEQIGWHKKIDNLDTFKIDNMTKLTIRRYLPGSSLNKNKVKYIIHNINNKE